MMIGTRQTGNTTTDTSVNFGCTINCRPISQMTVIGSLTAEAKELPMMP